MKMTFVDTSAFVPLFDDESDLRERVVKALKDASSMGMLITTDYVLDELFTIVRCRDRLPIPDILKFVDNINISDTEVVGITKELFQEALFMMGKYNDQYFSFTDCVSFTVMKEMGIKDFVGFDRHFATAGFNNLLK